MIVEFPREDGRMTVIRGTKIINDKAIWLTSTWNETLGRAQWRLEYEDGEEVEYQTAEQAQGAFDTLELDEALKG